MNNQKGLRVVVADDHPVYREGLSALLSDRGVQICASVATGEEVLEAVATETPAVVLLDLAMPGIGGIETTRRLVASHPSVAVLILTMSASETSLSAALRAGARGYLLKEATADEIVHALRSVASGQAVIGTGMSARALESLGGSRPFASRAFPELTEREFEVLELMARGRANNEIAVHLGVAEKTVRNNVSVLLTKLATTSRAEAIAKARDAGVGEPN